jgi:hypothetical protein
MKTQQEKIEYMIGDEVELGPLDDGNHIFGKVVSEEELNEGIKKDWTPIEEAYPYDDSMGDWPHMCKGWVPVKLDEPYLIKFAWGNFHVNYWPCGPDGVKKV